ncbi:MAG: class I SAM-dependent methyltransferase [Deltaproteobacteria bacterium]|nr:class I SAM-dependent methyltransferase [Deltaproteobacteria bacterium]
MLNYRTTIQHYFDDEAHLYSKTYTGDNELGKEVVDRYLSTLIPFVPRKKTLEIGCGPATFTRHFSQSAWMVGVDFSSSMLEFAQKSDPQAHFTQADGQELPFRNESFDVVYSFRTLQHIPDTQRAVSEMYRVLKDNGVLIIDYINIKNPLGWVRAKVLKSTKYVYLKAMRWEQVKALCSLHQLHILEHKPVIFFLDSSNLFKYLPIFLAKGIRVILNLRLFRSLGSSFLSRYALRQVVIARKGGPS